MYIKSSRIYMEDGIKSGYLHISAGKFEDFTTEKPCEEPIIAYGDLKIIPGIFDTHNHGTCGYTLEGVGNEEENRKNVYGYLKGCASQGITSIFPTAEPGQMCIRDRYRTASSTMEGSSLPLTYSSSTNSMLFLCSSLTRVFSSIAGCFRLPEL